MDDPRKCPICGKLGRRRTRAARFMGGRLFFRYWCHGCRISWIVHLQRGVIEIPGRKK